MDRRQASDEGFFTKIADLTRKMPFYGLSGAKDAPFAAQCMIGLCQRSSHDGARREFEAYDE
jgi:hypothetical protein